MSPKEPPDNLPPDGILLGYSLEHERRTAPIGFVYGTGEPEPTPASANGEAPTLDPILHTGGGHLMTIAPTGGGKGVSCVIPTLLRFPGPIIVIDPKGENYAVTAERRRKLGQEVVVLDPIGITGAAEVGALNPLDLVDSDESQSIDDSAALSSLLSGGIEKEDPRNLFWYQRGEQLLTGIIQFVAITRPDERRNLSEVRRILNLPADKFIALANTEMANCPDADVRQVAGTLVNPAEEMIGSILGMAQNSLGFLRGELLHESTASSSFDLEAVTAGDPISIYIVIPPDKLESHRNLLRLWIGTLMSALMRRRAPVPHSTLFVLDEAAQLGPLEQLRQAITLMRGYGLQTWSFWQDVSQLGNLYPRDWETMYNNCRVHQAFGFTTLKAATATCDLLGFYDALEALQLDSDEMILSVSGDEAVIAQKPNYLTDAAFQGLYSPNPFYTRSPDIPPRPRRPKRVYVRPAAPSPSSGGVVIDEVARVVPETEASSEEGDSDGDTPSPLEEAFEEALRVESRPAPSASRWHGGLFDPLPEVSVPGPNQVPDFLDMVSDETEGGWNPVTTLVRGVEYPFYPGRVFVELLDPTREPPRSLGIRHGKGFRTFEGGAAGFEALNREVPLQLDAENVAQYLGFAVHFQRFGEHRVRLAQSLDQLAFWTGASPDELASLAGLVQPATVEAAEGGAGWRVTVSGLVDGDLCELEFAVTGEGEIRERDRRVVREAVADLGGYPESGPGGAPTDAGDARLLGEVHGEWTALSAPERRAMLPDVPNREAFGPDPVVLRRALRCYPSVEVVVLWNRSTSEPDFFFYRPGKCHRVWLDTVWPSEKNRFGEGHVAWPDPGAAEDYVRLFEWFSNEFPEHPLDYRILLDRFEHLPLRSDHGLDLARLEAMREAWMPLAVVSDADGAGDAPLWRLRGTMLAGTRVLTVELDLLATGDVRGKELSVLGDDLPLDPDRVKQLLVFPSLGRARTRGPVADAAASPAEELE